MYYKLNSVDVTHVDSRDGAPVCGNRIPDLSQVKQPVRGRHFPSFAAGMANLASLKHLQAAGILILLLVSGVTDIRAQGRAMEVEDIMKFRQIVNPELSLSGQFVIYEATPDRGDGTALLIDELGEELIRLERGTSPGISDDDRWMMARIHKPWRERLTENSQPDSLVVVRTDRSDTLRFGNVEEARFSRDSRWLMVMTRPDPDQPDKPGERTPPGGTLSVYSLLDDAFLQNRPDRNTPRDPITPNGDKSSDEADSSSDENRPDEFQPSRENHAPDSETRRRLFHADGVRSFSVDSLSTRMVYAVVDSAGDTNALLAVDLQADSLAARIVHRQKNAVYDGFTWHEKQSRLAFLYSREDGYGNPSPAELYVWNGPDWRLDRIAASNVFGDDRVVPLHSELTWSRDGNRLFFGWQPVTMYRHSLYREKEEQSTVTDRDTILAEAEVDVWHGRDPLIKPHEKQTWEQRRDHTYLVVYHFDRNRLVELADDRVPYVTPVDNGRYALGRNPRPYKREITWDGWYSDYYMVNLRDGSRQEVIDRLRSAPVSLSPNGRYVLFYESEHWHLYDADRNIIHNLTEPLGVSFADEDHDAPHPPNSYGMAGWVEGDRAVVIYDKYDIWQIDTRSREALNLTAGEGRRLQRQFRIAASSPEHDAFLRNEHLLVRSFNERNKEYGFYGVRIGREGCERFLEGPWRYEFVGQSKSGERILFTRESYREFPDLWVSDRRLRFPRKATLANPWIGNYAWGNAELVQWRDMDGEPLDGVLITPDNYTQGEPVPVLVYFYEQFSHRLHHFNEQVINHRPGFPFYASNGYAVFLPDVRYDIGIPGFSATRSIVPGVQMLIDRGIADPEAIALHGHSWSGYQAAHMATQTHIFAAIIAGAPVSNMTSAYSGIRHGSGLARQFQYEQTQSRIGGSLWEKRDKYIENSPVFYADRIRTPMLIMFGDRDDAVPWEQGIELYLAMRRLQKDVIFLQYRNEPHHPQQYANKLDYFLRMKEYLDHHLKGAPAPDWIRKGVPYTGE
ncbi:prolyl oligopeptidase family serine peptidase [Balneolales bacterium ANBcel1]|nr:prolyl oligopeptidase family serine peptidase [Balneolales bacterium ANBcel1]